MVEEKGFLIRRRPRLEAPGIEDYEPELVDRDSEEEEEEEEDEKPPRGVRIPIADQPRSTKDPDFDIFSDLTPQTLEKMGKNPIYFMIYRNSRQEFLAEREYPYSWGKLQTEFGAGFYLVMAREKGTQRIVTIQSKQIGEPSNAGENNEMNVAEVLKMVEQRLANVQPAKPETPNVLELLTTVFALQEKMKTQAPDNSGIMQSIIGLVQAQSEKTAQAVSDQTKFMLELTMKMQENTNNVLKSMNETNAKMFEKFNEKIEKLGESKPQDNGLSYTPQDVMKIQMEAQQMGFQMWQNLEQMAESKAQQRIAVIESVRSHEIEEAQPKSLAEKMFDAVTPALASLVTSTATGIPLPAARPALPPRRPKPKRPHPVKSPTPASPSVSDDLPKASLEAEPMSDPLFVEYLSALQPILVTAWESKQTIADTSTNLLSSLQSKGISPHQFLSVCSLEKIEAALRPFGLTDDVFAWTRELYAHFTSTTTMDARAGGSSPSTEL